jgi:ring-1,2-phenylacetyl-CoA epoxidase subunit PaaA
MQADSELAGGYGYVPWITKAPTVEEKHVVAQIVKDELRHATVMYGLLADLGFDVESHVRQHDEIFTMRIDAGRDIGTARITSDKRVNIFYYPIDTWADFIFFNFCMDRGAGHQLEDVRGCSYGPWVRAIDGIFKEEKFHIRHGEYWVKKARGRRPHPRRGPDHLRQVVHPHDEHLRPARIAEESSLSGSSSSSSVTTTRCARRSPPR